MFGFRPLGTRLSCGMAGLAFRCLRLMRLQLHRICVRFLCPYKEIVTFRKDSQIDTGVSDDERGSGRKALGNLSADLRGDLKTIERTRRVVTV